MEKKLWDKGVATVEATLIMPIFIFAMLTIYYMAQCRLVENIIYDAGVKTAEYMAQIAYINEDLVYAAQLVYGENLEDVDLVSDFVEGGVSGIDFLGTTGVDEEGYFTLVMNYDLYIWLPFVPKLDVEKSVAIRQRAYLGSDIGKENQEISSDEKYVYITDNREVYHSSRTCSYLELSIHSVPRSAAVGNGYTPCEYCGSEEGGMVLITDYGERYHYSSTCSGLKRSIYRVKLSDVEGLGGCIRCVGY